MKKYFLVLCLNLFTGILTAQSGTDIIKNAYKKYKQGPCKSYTFSQKNTHYKNESVTGHSEWHEAIEFPDKFRIDFGDKSTGNFVIFKNDSVFNYKKNELVKTHADSSTLLLLLGGMFYRNLDDVLRRIKNAHYDLKIVSIQKWNSSDTYVVGAKEKDLSVNQIWIDKKTLRVMRILEKMNEEDTMDMRFEAHQDWCTGYMETKVSFRRNGKLEQVEEYFNIKETKSFSDSNH